MIRSFGNKSTEDFYHGRRTSHARRIAASLRSAAVRKLNLINAAAVIEDLRVPPGNRLEKLSGELKDYHSIRINDQWRVIFRWSDGGADEVELIDYHR